MRLSILPAVLFAFLLAIPATPAMADYSEGVKALKEQDYKKGFELLMPVAEQGDPRAQYCIGLLYSWGEGVPQSYAEALKWYTMSANQGHSGAQNNLGLMYLNGLGVDQDFVTAYMWFNLAAANGNEKAQKNRDDLSASMTDEQILAAQNRSLEWKPQVAEVSPEPSPTPQDADLGTEPTPEGPKVPETPQTPEDPESVATEIPVDTPDEHVTDIDALPDPGAGAGEGESAFDAASDNALVVAGVWDTGEAFGELALDQFDTLVDGTFARDNGRVESEIVGGRLEGVWAADTSDQVCAEPRLGSTYWGRFTLEVGADGQTMTGHWGYCDQDTDQEFTAAKIR